MQTQLLSAIRATSEGKTAETILRKCVHCGFCNATCPTYQLLGDENEGPRGRIYLIKQLLEGKVTVASKQGQKTLQHLDHCLLCRSCETTCPSGVEYGKLLDIGRSIAEQQVGRPRLQQIIRERLNDYLPDAQRFKKLHKLGTHLKNFLPHSLARKIPAVQPAGYWPPPQHARKVLVLQGCVQSTLSPDTNAATARVLDRLGISLITAEQAGCCGAVSQHLGHTDQARDYMRRNIDAWWPYLSQGVEAIITTASGCGATVKDYKYYLKDDPTYAIKAERISYLSKDIAEIIGQEDYSQLAISTPRKVAWHPPCSLQHGQKIRGLVETILTQCGFELMPVQDEHLCCGSAGTYSLLQPQLAEPLRTAKLANLTRYKPELIITANIGCQNFLQEKSAIPVIHWIKLLDATIS